MYSDRLPLDTLVELQDQYSNVYPLSPTGARGWIRARRELPKTDPEIYIEWDKSHWRYHAEKDGWTFEHHFRAVNDAALELSEHQIPQLQDIVEDAHRKLDEERCEACGDIHDEGAAFIDTLMRGQEAALGSDGYFMITLTPRQENGLMVYEPELYTETLTPAARKVIHAQLVDVAAQLITRHLFEQVHDIERPQDDPGR